MKWSLVKLVLNVVLIPAFILISMRITAPDAITENIIENAPRFYILGIKGTEMKMLVLSDAIENMEGYEFHLNQHVVNLNVGDMHQIKVIENTGDAQVIQFNYQNTYNSSSLYKVSNNKVTPLQYKVNNHIGQAPVFVLALITAIVLSSLSVGYLKRRYG